MLRCRPHILILLIILLLGFPSAAHAQSGPLKIRLLLAQGSVSEGEPVVVRYEIENNTDYPCSFTRLTLKNWIRFAVVDGQGRKKAQQPPIQEIVGASRVQTIPAHEILRGNVPLGLVAAHLPSGNYHVKASVHLFYHFHYESDFSRSFVYNETWDLTISITPPDREKLIKLAKQIRSQVFTSKREEQEAALIALFSLPEVVARPYWESVVARTGADDVESRYVAPVLEELASPTAVRLLIRLWNSGDPQARQALYRMYYHGPAKFKPRILTEFRAREGKRLGKEMEMRFYNVN